VIAFAMQGSGLASCADETEVKLRNGIKGYVWVLASVEDVIYFFRPNREGKFLKDMLKDFKGVLGTDFYGAYESLDCRSRACRRWNRRTLPGPRHAGRSAGQASGS
jgi:hypothetical protein